MRGVSAVNHICSGHDCFPPRPAISGSNNVYVEGNSALNVGSGFAEHCCDGECHTGSVDSGSNTVYVNGNPIARIGDSVDCGSIIAQGVSTVLAG